MTSTPGASRPCCNSQALAGKIWSGSGKTLNPRYFYSCYTIINHLKLLSTANGVCQLDERGRRFLAGDSAILRDLVALRLSKRARTRQSFEQD